MEKKQERLGWHQKTIIQRCFYFIAGEINGLIADGRSIYADVRVLSGRYLPRLKNIKSAILKRRACIISENFVCLQDSDYVPKSTFLYRRK
jgi:hypothetical protein